MPSGMEYEVCWEGGTMIERFSDLSADGLGPMEHTVAEYPVVRGSSPRDGCGDWGALSPLRPRPRWQSSW
jgi:hypothetical protein